MYTFVNVNIFRVNSSSTSLIEISMLYYWLTIIIGTITRDWRNGASSGAQPPGRWKFSCKKMAPDRSPLPLYQFIYVSYL